MKVPQGIAAVLLLVLPPATASSRADEDGEPRGEPVLALAVDTDGPTCGLGKDFHAGRRAELRRRLGDGLVVLRGMPETRDYVAFRQDKNFWYLTGVESPGCALIIDVESGREILFVAQRTRRLLGLERWEGEKWDDEDAWVQELTGFTEVMAEPGLHRVLGELLSQRKKVWTCSSSYIGLSGCYDRAEPFDRRREDDIFDGRKSRERAFARALEKRYGAEVHDIKAELNDMRRVKVGPELDAVRRASRIAALAMTEAVRSTRPGIGEWELDALMTFEFLRRGAAGPAYDAIVGSEANSLILHYLENDRRLGAGEVVLIDYAPEVDHYVSDVTRTWPTDGRWTPRMAELYDVVLAAQKAGIAAVRPGGTIAEVERACSAAIRAAGMQRYVLHGACHYVGMEVHDVGEYSKPLEPGVVFTIEPGLYDRDERIGIRIEDVVLVTGEGCEVLSADAPKERGELSRLLGEEGVLDRIGESAR